MRVYSRWGWLMAMVSVAIVAGALVSGCRSTPKIDWNSRVGNYTQDQAILDFGPPDRSAKLSDGKTVAEWITPSRTGTSFGLGTGVFGGHGGVSVGQSVGVGGRARVLRLTFDTENRLVEAVDRR